jgi:hypothetical protein
MAYLPEVENVIGDLVADYTRISVFRVPVNLKSCQ